MERTDTGFYRSPRPEYAEKMDVLSFQLTYLNVTESDDIADPERGFFAG